MKQQQIPREVECAAAAPVALGLLAAENMSYCIWCARTQFHGKRGATRNGKVEPSLMSVGTADGEQDSNKILHQRLTAFYSGRTLAVVLTTAHIQPPALPHAHSASQQQPREERREWN